MTLFKLTRIKLLGSFLGLAVLFNLLAGACGIKKPQAPSWLSTWELPLINRTIALSDILQHIDDSGIVFDTAGNPGIEIRETLDTVLVSENLSLATADFDLKDSVGIIEIEPPQAVGATTYLNQILPINIGYVPPAPFEFNQPVQRLDNFTWAEVAEGTMDFTFHNLLEVDLDTLIVTVIDSVDYHIIGILNFERGLDYLEQETQSLDISGQRISNAIFLAYHGHTPGGPLVNAGDQQLSADISFPDTIAVRAARAQIPEIVRQSSERYEIDDSTKVYSSTISQGVIVLDIINGTELPFDVTLRSPNFTLGGAAFQTHRQLGPRGFSQVSIDLSRYDFIPEDGFPSQSVVVEMTSVVQSSAPLEYTFRAADSLTVHVNISRISFSAIDGRIAPQTITIDPVTRTLDFPEGLDQAHLSRGHMALTLYNNSMIPAFVDVVVEGGGKSLTFVGLIEAKTNPSAAPVATTLAASSEQSSIFLSPPPSEILVYGDGVINPGYAVVSLRSNDSFTGEAVISSPLEFVIGDTVNIRPEITSLCLGDSRPDDDVGDNLQYGQVRATLENHLPLGTIATIFIGTRSDSSFYTDPATIRLGPFSLAAAETDQAGFSVRPAISDIIDSLSSQELALFENDSLFMGEMIDILPTASSGVVVSGNDNIRIAAMARLELLLGD